MTTSTPTVVLRRASTDDAEVVLRLAVLDSSRAPQGDVVLAEVRGEPVAAVSLDDGHLVADPFVPTADAADLLREHARGVRAGRGRRSAYQRLRLARA